jgi:hypothetical protein
MNNAQRAEYAYRTLLVFRQYTGNDTTEEAIGDLLANIMHLCDEHGYTFSDLLATAEGHYTYETEHPEEDETAPPFVARPNPDPDRPGIYSWTTYYDTERGRIFSYHHNRKEARERAEELSRKHGPQRAEDDPARMTEEERQQ